MEQINSTSLCFYKFLLLKSTTFKDKTINPLFLEQETNISRHHIVGSLQELLKQGIIHFSKEALTRGFSAAYQLERKKIETHERRKQVAGYSGGTAYDPTATELWKTHYADKNCGLEEEIFKQLERDSRVSIPLTPDAYAKLAKQEGDPLLFFAFQLHVDDERLKKFLSDYLSAFRNDEVNDGKKFAYWKQKQDVAIAIAGMINAGFARNSLLIDSAQIWPRGKTQTRPTDGRALTAILLYDFIDTILAMEQEGCLEVLEIIYPSSKDRVVMHSGLIWEDPIQVRIKVLQPFIDYYNQLIASFQKSTTAIPSTPKFHFSEGILHRDGQSEVLKFSEDDLQYNVVAVAFDNPTGTRIDCVTEGIDASNFRQIYDAATRINEKVEQQFKVKNFFTTDWKNKYVIKAVE